MKTCAIIHLTPGNCSVEQMSAQVEDVSAQAAELAETAQQPQTLVVQFRLDANAAYDDADEYEDEYRGATPVTRRRSGDWGSANDSRRESHRWAS
jgi:hypothetical protein